MSKTLAIVVSFHPDTNFEENINLLADEVDHIVIIDNESAVESRQKISGLKSNQITCVFNSSNNGVARGFNQGIHWGMEQGFDKFLLMDQDSRPQQGMVAKLSNAISATISRGGLVLVGPRHEDFDRKIPFMSSEAYHEVPLLITSGSLLSRQVVEKVGIYDERLFIDHVDHDYCLRLRKQGGVCLQVNTAILLHKFGNAKVKTFLGKTFFLQEYSAFRRYYMMRNRIVLYKRYGMFNGIWFWMDLRSAVKDLIKLVFFESAKAEKIKAVINGLIDGLKWKD